MARVGNANRIARPRPKLNQIDSMIVPSKNWLAWILRPAPLIGLGVALSMAAWATARTLAPEVVGFSANLTAGTLIYLCWVAMAIGLAHVGFITARPRVIAGPANQATGVRALQWGLLIAATVGVGYVVAIWMSDGLDVVGLILDNQANRLRQSIPLSAGVATLRYAAIPAAAIAIRNLAVYGWRRHQDRSRWSDILALALLAIVALPASRLAVLMALATAAVLLWYIDRRVPEARTLFLAAILTALLLGALNYSRNGNFYRESGISSPAAMQLYQTASYLGAAFEGGSVAGNALLGRTSLTPPSGGGKVLEPLTPSFLPVIESGSQEGVSIHEISSIDRSLTANSMFAGITLGLGVTPIATSLLAIFGFSALAGTLLRRGNLASVLSAGPILYSFAEVYRLNLFNNGVIVFCVAWPMITNGFIALVKRSGARA